jgi:hypothetical protein
MDQVEGHIHSGECCIQACTIQNITGDNFSGAVRRGPDYVGVTCKTADAKLALLKCFE